MLETLLDLRVGEPVALPQPPFDGGAQRAPRPFQPARRGGLGFSEHTADGRQPHALLAALERGELAGTIIGLEEAQ